MTPMQQVLNQIELHKANLRYYKAINDKASLKKTFKSLISLYETYNSMVEAAKVAPIILTHG